jgi:hypothetical protein
MGKADVTNVTNVKYIANSAKTIASGRVYNHQEGRSEFENRRLDE